MDIPEPFRRGETNLQTLLQNMRPKLQEAEFVFCSVDPETVSRLPIALIGQFLEKEGMIIIVEKTDADAEQLDY